MRSLRTFRYLQLIGVGFALCNCSALTKQIAILDKSEKGSPLAISGVLVFNDDGPEATPYSIEFHETAKNTSSKPIQLLIIETRITSDPDQSPNTFSNDYFFSPKTLEPGNVADVSVSSPRYGPRHETSNPPRLSPAVNVAYVEFGDGTHWGNLDSAREPYRIRASTLAELHILRNAYESGGDEAFVSELLRAENHAIPGIAGLQNSYDSSGLEAAEIKAWTMFDAANSHQNEMPTSPSAAPKIPARSRTKH